MQVKSVKYQCRRLQYRKICWHRGASSCCVDIEAVMDIEGGIKVKKKKNKDDYKDNNEGNSD